MSSPLVTIVTGANRGIGEAICRILASTTSQPMILYAASRKGLDLNIHPSSSTTTLCYPTLDIADPTSVSRLANQIKQDHVQIDVLINNAGVNLDTQYSAANAKTTLNTNYRGTLRMCQAFIPLLKKGTGRIVNVSSVASSLNGYSSDIQNRFRNQGLTLDELEGMMNEYLSTTITKTEISAGWKPQSYSVSKAAINALTAILARSHPDITINACCPGWVATDMGSQVGRPPKTPSEGAKIPIRLAFGDVAGVTGRYWANAGIRDTQEGELMSW